MKSRIEAGVLACIVAGWATGALAQENCNGQIDRIATIGDVQTALNCVEAEVAASAERTRQLSESNKKQVLQQIDENLELVTAKVRHVSLGESTNGNWKQVPESGDAHACFLSSVRLPAQGLCQITYQGNLGRWAFNVSNPTGAGFTCTATCVWMGLKRKPEADK